LEVKLKFYVEVQPSRFRDKLDEQFAVIKEVSERVHVPDAPMGYPKASSIVIAFLALAHGLRATVHLRTIDYSYVGFLNQIYGAHLIGIDKVLLLRGDPPYRGSTVSDVSPEEGLRIIRSDERLSVMKVGFILSLRYPIEKIRERIFFNPDFVLVTHKSREKLSWLTDSYGGEKIGYLIVSTPRNEELVKKLPQREDICRLEKLAECIEESSVYLDSLLISCPEDIKECVYALKKIM
jgi:hypothetical protein